jgi:uncharacterized protein (DUF934 family)
MARLIKHRRLTSDSWSLLSAGATLADVPEAGDVIVPLALWREYRDVLALRAGRTGVWLEGHEDPAALANDLERLPLVAVKFAKFSDGRGLSTGRLLRERYGFTGELRAIGDVLRDQLLFLRRCGFDAFALRDDQDAAAAAAAFDDFTEAYQSGVDQPVPLFRRRPTNDSIR